MTVRGKKYATLKLQKFVEKIITDIISEFSETVLDEFASFKDKKFNLKTDTIKWLLATLVNWHIFKRISYENIALSFSKWPWNSVILLFL